MARREDRHGPQDAQRRLPAHTHRVHRRAVRRKRSVRNLDHLPRSAAQDAPGPQAAKKRLTSPLYLACYARLLRPDGWINLKTDSKHLYAYTGEVIRHYGLTCEVSEPDIYGSGFADEVLSVKTAYETRFLEMGLPITYTRFALGGRHEFPWFDWEEDDKEEKDNEAERQLR